MQPEINWIKVECKGKIYLGKRKLIEENEKWPVDKRNLIERKSIR